MGSYWTGIDEFLRFGGAAEGGFTDGGRFAYERDHGPVGRFARIYVEHFYALNRGDGSDNVVNHGFIASLAVVGDAFDNLFHIGSK